jgi:hypothetical protein
MPTVLRNVRFSNRPFGVKRFQTIHHHSVDVARGLVLLFGIGTKALVWGFLCQGVGQGGEAFLRRFLGSISKPVSSSRPADVDARKICTRLAVTPTLRHASPLPGHTMTASSTTAR